MREAVKLDVLFSRTGSYVAVSGAMYVGAMLVIEEVNANCNLPIKIEPVVRDLGGVTANYLVAAAVSAERTPLRIVS